MFIIYFCIVKNMRKKFCMPEDKLYDEYLSTGIENLNYQNINYMWIKITSKIEDDLKRTWPFYWGQVFRHRNKYRMPRIGLPLGNKNNMDLSVLEKYVSKKKELE